VEFKSKIEKGSGFHPGKSLKQSKAKLLFFSEQIKINKKKGY